MVLGALAILGGWLIEVSVSARGFGEVANLHAMHLQSLVVLTGGIGFIAGAVLYGFGTLEGYLRHTGGDATAVPAPTIERPSVELSLEEREERKATDRRELFLMVGTTVALVAGAAVIAFLTA